MASSLTRKLNYFIFCPFILSQFIRVKHNETRLAFMHRYDKVINFSLAFYGIDPKDRNDTKSK